MFNNPLESFHDMVAEAKEDREQLDRLLTISTPRERLLVAATAMLLGVIVAWLFLGSVARSLEVDGVLVGQGEILSDGGRSVQTLLWVNSEVAPHIAAGMPAEIEPETADGEGGVLEGTVRAIAAEPLSGGPAAFGTAAPVSAHRIEIALEAVRDESPDLDTLAGVECRVYIELGRQSPIGLFLKRRE